MKTKINMDTKLFKGEQNAPRREKRTSQIRLLVLVALLLAAGLLLWRHSAVDQRQDAMPAPTAAPTAIPTQPPSAQTARQTREAAYEKDLAMLRQLSQDETLQEETRQQAAEQIARMVQQHQLELGLEEMLINAGFAPCMVLMQNDALTVSVSASQMTAADSAVILSICLTHTEVAAENIRIMQGSL